MKKSYCIAIHDSGASTYVSQVEEYNSHMHEILFGMCYEYINSGDSRDWNAISSWAKSIDFQLD